MGIPTASRPSRRRSVRTFTLALSRFSSSTLSLVRSSTLFFFDVSAAASSIDHYARRIRQEATAKHVSLADKCAVSELVDKFEFHRPGPHPYLSPPVRRVVSTIAAVRDAVALPMATAEVSGLCKQITEANGATRSPSGGPVVCGRDFLDRFMEVTHHEEGCVPIGPYKPSGLSLQRCLSRSPETFLQFDKLVTDFWREQQSAHILMEGGPIAKQLFNMDEIG